MKASKTGTILNDFRVELAKSSGAACRVCEVKIKKNEPRVGKKELEDQRARYQQTWNDLDNLFSNLWS